MMNLHMYSAAMFHGNDGRSSETSDPLELLLLLLMKLTVNSPSYEPTAISSCDIWVNASCSRQRLVAHGRQALQLQSHLCCGAFH